MNQSMLRHSACYYLVLFLCVLLLSFLVPKAILWKSIEQSTFNRPWNRTRARAETSSFSSSIPYITVTSPKIQELLFNYSHKKIIILYWSNIRNHRPRLQSPTDYWRDPYMWPYTYVGDNCPVSCSLTANRSMASQASAFVVHSRSGDVDDLPPLEYLAPWILQNNENPVYTPVLSKKSVMSKFNLLISYRLDSDFPSPVYPKPSLHKPIPFQERFGDVLALFSKCEPVRTEYIKQLMKYIQVDSYGDCLKNRQGFVGIYRQVQGHYVFKDFKMVLSRFYRFSLVFMNQDCDYFVDDRLYHALDSGSVPVYMGSDRVYDFLPGHLHDSIINVRDYAGPRELALHLTALSRNESEYSKYLRWKIDGLGDYRETVIGRWWDRKYPLFCQVCMRLAVGNLRTGLPVDTCKARTYKDWGLVDPTVVLDGSTMLFYRICIGIVLLIVVTSVVVVL